MSRTQNVILFSAGETVRNGKADYIKAALQQNNVNCLDWNDLFRNVRDRDHVALLPVLMKKIPTFDFALIFAEGVDEVTMRGKEHYKTMRDNVLFEIGLCTMALGAERVILLTDETVRIPDDLMGVGDIGIAHITFSDNADFDRSVDSVNKLIDQKAANIEALLSAQVDSILNHIHVKAETVFPVFIGAAVSSAEAYFLNFIVRLLENTDQGFHDKSKPAVKQPFPDDFAFKIFLPAAITSSTRRAIFDYYERMSLSSCVIEHANSRALEFKMGIDPATKTMTIVDIPTSVTASYSVVTAILNLPSDEEYDDDAEERFVTKEIDIYEYTLRKLLAPEIAEKRLTFIQNPDTKNAVLRALSRVTVERIKLT